MVRKDRVVYGLHPSVVIRILIRNRGNSPFPQKINLHCNFPCLFHKNLIVNTILMELVVFQTG